jgi:hypothetical protein
VEVWNSAWAQLGAVGFLALFVLAILAGRLVARSWVKTLLDQAELRAQAAERNADRWQAAAEASDKRADLFGEQLGEVLSAMRAVEALVRALPGQSRDPQREAA